MDESLKVNLEDIKNAAKTIEPFVQKTQLSFSRSCSKWIGSDVYLKYENEQLTGSFKVRGAYNKISQLTDLEKKRGIVASSAGNHAQGVALAATHLGSLAHVVMPEQSPLIKVTATQGYGAKVILHGEFFDDAYAHARYLEKENNYVFVHPYEDSHIIAGQGTIGLEILNELSGVESIVVPLGGGGLISGIAVAAKEINPKIKIFGVVSDNTPSMYHMFKGEDPSKSKLKATIADGTAVKTPSKAMYQNFISKYVDEIVRVKDDEIAEAMVFLLERAKTVVEGAGAMALAGAVNHGLPLGQKTVLILSGGNVDLNAIATIIDRGLGKRGRLARLKVVVPDKPGSLHRITGVLAKQNANILETYHDRLGFGIDLGETTIELLIETKSAEHIEKIKIALREEGAKII